MRCQTAPPEAAPPEAAPPEAVAPEGAASEVVTSRAGNLRAVQFQVWDVPTLRTRLDEVVAVYRAAFLDVYERDPDRAAAERRVHARTHLERPGVRAVAALAPATPVPPAELVGFAYGHPGRDGQWWHDVVTRSVPPTVARTWFGDCFEVVELHVLPDWQGRGIGRTLLRMLLSQARTETAALSALAGPDTRARRLYDSEQFHPLHDRFRFPGSPTEYAILVKRLRPASRHDARDGAPVAALS
jgi:GNAT superfamily N-acetyltransferase